MCFFALRVTAFVMLLQLSQVTPGLSCTFTEFSGARLYYVRKAAVAYNSTFEICFEKCYETPDCNFIVFNINNNECDVWVPGGYMVRRSAFTQPEIYRFDRNVTCTSCPTVKQWIARRTNVGV